MSDVVRLAAKPIPDKETLARIYTYANGFLFRDGKRSGSPVQRNCLSRLKGAHYGSDKRRDLGLPNWRSQIRVQRKLIFLGYFRTPEEAHVAYCNAAALHSGGFARTA